MVKVVGPMMSLTASGNFASTLNFYYGPEGAVVRRKKRVFTAPSQIWYVNQEAFSAASTRWKSFSKVQQNAWDLSFINVCDLARDLFMGKQIEMWNLHPDNDLSWPEKIVPSYPDFVGKYYFDAYSDKNIFYIEMSGEKMGEWRIPGFKWYACTSGISYLDSIEIGETIKPKVSISTIPPNHPYCWVRAWRSNGVLDLPRYIANA